MKRLILALALAPAIAGFGVEYVDYIHGDGASRIETDYKPTKDARVAMVVEFGDDCQMTQPMALFCSRGNSATKDTFTFLKLYTSPSAHWRFDYAQTAGTLSAAPVENNVRYAIDVSKAGAFVNGEKVGDGSSVSFTPGNKLVLFASYRSGLTANLADYGTFRLYSCQVYDTVNGVTDTLVCDLKPAVDENGVYGLYDIQRGIFLGNAGTGSFRGPTEVSVDSASALTAALSAATVGTTIVLEDGAYEIGDTLTVPKGVTLKSRNGREKVRFVPAAGAKRSTAVVVATGGTSVIRGITFDGFAYSAASPVVYLGHAGVLRDCRVTGCVLSGSNYGGSVACGTGAFVQRCVIDHNTATTGTAGIGHQDDNGEFTVEYTLLYGNRSAIYMNGGSATFVHCTIADNLNSPTSAIIHNNNRSVVFRDCALLFATLPGMTAIGGIGGTTKDRMQINNCYVPGLGDAVLKDGSGDNVTDGDALFVEPIAGDYHLQAGSALIGKASGGGDIGCFAYDAGYEPSYPVVNLKPGDDVKAAIDAAAEGTVVSFAEGEYEIAEMITIDRSIHLVGAGRDKTILKSDGENHRILKIHGPRALAEKITFTGAKCSATGAAVWIGAYGGGLFDCRLTGNVSLDGPDGACVLAMGCRSVAYRVLVDDNAYATAEGVIGTAAGGAGVNFWKGDNESSLSPGAILDHCLICHNRGYGLYTNNQTTFAPDGTVRHCTIVGELGYANMSNTRGFTATRTIFLACSELPAAIGQSCCGADNEKPYNTCCFYDLSGKKFSTNAYCVVTQDPGFVNPRAKDYHLRADSPCYNLPEVGGYIGCYDYDPDYVPMHPVVELKDGDDLAAAVEAAADGTDILLGAGTYELSANITIDKPIRISGASRDSVFIEPASGAAAFRLMTLKHPLARIENLTLRRASGGAVNISEGGIVENCRVTECAASSTINGLAIRLEYGCANRCLIDRNTDINKDHNTTFVLVSSHFMGAGFAWRCGLFMNSLVTGNVADNNVTGGRQLRGYAVKTQRDGNDEDGYLRNVTVVGNELAAAFTTGDNRLNVAGEVMNCIFRDSPVSLTMPNVGTVAVFRNCYWSAPSATAESCSVNCSTDNPLVSRSGKLKPSSPCIGKAVTGRYVSHGLDFAGNPRVREDGTQDIGCNQWMPSGLMLLVK